MQRRVVWLRIVVFGLCTVAMWAGPTAHQVFGIHDPYLKPWMMFRGWGFKICDVVYETGPTDARVPVDRYAALGASSWWEASKKVRLLWDMEDVRGQGKKLCKTLPTGEPLYVRARCGRVGGGWVEADDGTEPTCRGSRRVDAAEGTP